MRDTLKSADYFERYLDQQRRRIEKFETQLAAGTVKQDRIPAVKNKILHLHREIVIASFSSGAAISHVQSQLVRLLSHPDIEQLEVGYDALIWLLSLAVIFDDDNQYADPIVRVAMKAQPSDFLVTFLNSALRPDAVAAEAPELAFPTPYRGLRHAIEIAQAGQRDDAADRLSTYLSDEWYQGHRTTGSSWPDLHASRYDLYFGYWSFETAAIVILFKLDDTPLRGLRYYPEDLVRNSPGSSVGM